MKERGDRGARSRCATTCRRWPREEDRPPRRRRRRSSSRSSPARCRSSRAGATRRPRRLALALVGGAAARARSHARAARSATRESQFDRRAARGAPAGAHARRSSSARARLAPVDGERVRLPRPAAADAPRDRRAPAAPRYGVELDLEPAARASSSARAWAVVRPTASRPTTGSRAGPPLAEICAGRRRDGENLGRDASHRRRRANARADPRRGRAGGRRQARRARARPARLPRRRPRAARGRPRAREDADRALVRAGRATCASRASSSRPT